MISFIDLQEQYNRIKEKVNVNIEKVLAHGKYIMGPEVSELEEKLSEFVGVKYTVTCSNGTDALLMPLMAWNIGPGDAVFIPTFTFVATAEVVDLFGATPVFVDIDGDTFNMDHYSLEEAIKKTIKENRLKPKVVIPVDLFGLPANYDTICTIAERYNLKILEDAAQGLGGMYKGKYAGSFGDVGTTSFFPAKPLGCYGDGGAIFMNDEDIYTKLKSIRVHGQGFDKYENICTGINGRLDTLQAAILLPKLEIFPEELKARERIAKLYTTKLINIVKTPIIPKGYFSSWAQYSVLAKDSEERNLYMTKLKEAGIPSMVYYRKPLHLQTVYKELNYQEGDFPIAEDVSRRIFSLPMHPYMTNELIDMIANIFR